MLDGDALEAVIAAERPDFILPEVEAIATDRLVALEARGQTVAPTARAVRLTMDREGIRRLAAEELGHHGEPEIDARGHAPGGDQGTVAHHPVLHRHRAEAGQEVVGVPVGRGLPTLQQAGRAEHQRPGADGGEVADLPGAPPHGRRPVVHETHSLLRHRRLFADSQRRLRRSVQMQLQKSTADGDLPVLSGAAHGDN